MSDKTFYVHGNSNQNYYSITLDGKGSIARVVVNGEPTERKFSGLLWQSPKMLAEFIEMVKPTGLDIDVKDIILEYDEWTAKKKSDEEDEAYENEGEYISTSGLTNPLVEEIITDGKPMFLTINSEPKYSDRIMRDGNLYEPILDDAIRQKAVLLPSGIEEYGTPELLIKELQEHITKYLDVDSSYVTFASYYALLSWVYDRLDTLPYLRALGDTGTGKSRFLRVLGGLCYKPIFVAGAITPAPIYRMIKRWGGTIVLDEADFKDSNEKNEVVTILNCGFSKGTPVIRCEKDNPDNVQILPTFSPKVIATRQTFGDKALESRCLTEIMKQTKRKDLPRILPAEFYTAEEKLRNKLLKFRFDYYNKVDTSKISEIKLGNIEPRLEQATISFAVLFYNIPEIFDLFKKFLFEYQKSLVEERAGSFDGQIVNIMLKLQAEVGDITPSNIAEVMSAEGFKTTSVTVGRHLKALKVDLKLSRSGKNVGRYIQLTEDQISSFKERYSVEYWDDQKFDDDKSVINQKSVTDVTDVTDVLGDYGIKKILCQSPNSLPEGGESHITVTTVTGVTDICSFCNNNTVIVGTKKQFDPFIEGKIIAVPVCASCDEILSRKDSNA